MRALQAAEYRVALARREPPGGRMVEREDAARLAEHGVRVSLGVDGRGDGLVRPLDKVDPGVVAQVVGDERQAHLARVRAGGRGARPEVEGRRRAEREGGIWVKLRCCNRHVTDLPTESDIRRETAAT